jgi:hypothetical protein
MIVTAIPSTEGTTTIDIKGYTQGIMGGTLKENVNGLRDYLMEALPYLDIQYKQIQQSESQDQNRSGIGIADEIERLSNLHKIGALSETEYAQAKQKVLSQ